MNRSDLTHAPPAPCTVTVVGGDRRMHHAAAHLAEAGCAVRFLGGGVPETDFSARVCTGLAAALRDADILLLPLPASRDGETVACPLDPSCRVTLAELHEHLLARPELRLFGGLLSPILTDGLPAEQAVDYYEDEALLLRNAYLTAEGAVMLAMEQTDHALRGSTVAVIGYGRIGKLLADLLLSLGAEVTVCARRRDALLWAAQTGCHPLRLGNPDRAGGGLFPLCYGHSVIFNTVPSHVLGREVLLRMEPGTVLIDLASAPFGAEDEDIREAGESGHIRYIRAPSLPGRYAPRDAGRAIAACVTDCLARSESYPKGGRES